MIARTRARLFVLPMLGMLVSTVVGCGGGGGGGGGSLSAPTALTAVATPVAGQLSLTWDDVPGATLYKVYVSPEPGIAALRVGAPLEGFYAQGTRLAPLVLTGLLDGARRYVAVTAMNAAGEGALSAETSATPRIPAPGAVTVSGIPTSLVVTWHAVDGADAYDVFLASDPSLSSATWDVLPDAAHVATPTLSATFSGLVNGATYYVVVVAHGAAGPSADSVVVSGTPDGRGTFSELGALVAGAGPNGVVAAYLDGDAVLDLAVLDGADDTVSVFLGVGDGTFVPAGVFDTGASPSALIAADADGDGILDLVTANNVDATVSVLIGDGTGLFAPRNDFFVGGAPASLDAGSIDADVDGILDLVVADAGGSAAVVLYGFGGGFFSGPVPFAVGTGAAFVRVTDLNGDGRLDVVTANPAAGTVTSLLGDGVGSFSLRQDASAGAGPTALETGDFDGDGLVDVAVSSQVNGTVTILHGMGDGAFVANGTVATGAKAGSIVAGDFNGDGKADLAVTNGGAGTVTVLIGGGGGVFTKLVDVIAGAGPVSIAMGDYNGDGILDLAVTNVTDGTVSILLGSAV